MIVGGKTEAYFYYYYYYYHHHHLRSFFPLFLSLVLLAYVSAHIAGFSSRSLSLSSSWMKEKPENEREREGKVLFG